MSDDLRSGSATAVLDHVEGGADVVVPIANGEPVAVLDALEQHHADLDGVRVHQMHVLHDRPYLHGGLRPHLTHVSYFLSHVTRPAYWAGGLELVPAHFSEVPTLLRRVGCDLVVAAAAPVDADGCYSLGTSADYVASLVGEVPFFLEVNPRMPRTRGRNQVHVSQVVGTTEREAPLVEVPAPPVTDLDRRIAALVADRIEHGSTMQAGIGAIPGAILSLLRDHQDLGLHTELLSDGVVDLVEAGALTGARKTHGRGKHVATFVLGSQRAYEFVDENDAVELAPVDHVNDPRVIGREPRFVSINATVEVDLLGQCASESIAGRPWSGSGGQADFARGAMYSEGGQGFVVLRSTTKDGTSRIVPRLASGQVVTTLRNTVDHVVTEHGVAELRGRSVAQRAKALISVAHPDHRDLLRHEARSHGLL